VIAYELGYRARLGQKVTASISTFYNDYDQIRSTSLTPVTILPFFFENNLEGKTYGGELSANYQVLDWWRLHGGYNLLKEHIRVKPGETDFNNALNETGDPEHQYALRSSMDLPHNVQLDANLRWVDELHVNNAGVAETVPSYHELDVRIGWRPISSLELSVVGQNLLHNHHPEFGPPSPTRVEIQRSVYGKIAWRF
jgi:iron complex outermembrane receptor protein